jgi:hypothetical protein
MALIAENEIRLLAAKNTANQKSNNRVPAPAWESLLVPMA